MRVTQQMLFDRYVGNMNKSLTSLIDLNTKAQTQKKINRPSDDPTGMTRILSHRDTLRSIEQYKENISTAKGWLNSQSEAMTQVSTLLTRAKELATQISTGSVDGDNREQVSYELRSIFDQMIGLANTEFENNSIFGGHKVGEDAYEKIMWLTTNDDRFSKSVDFTVNGSAGSTVLVQFYDSTGNTDVGGDMQLSDNNLRARFSTDGGDTWTDGTLAPSGSGYVLDMPGSGTSVTFHSDATVKVNDPTDKNVADGTWLWVRPSARYIGDDSDMKPQVDSFGPGSKLISASASGAFLNANVTIRIDNETDVGMDEDIQYSYSLDGGINWVTGNVAQADTTSNSAILSVANGGILTLASNGSNRLEPGQQFVVRPRSADINLDISANSQVTINNVGKDIFGGIYQDPDNVLASNGSIVSLSSQSASRVFQSNGAGSMYVTTQGQDEFSKNIFEVLGNLVAFAETNNQTGVQQCLANLESAHEHLMNNVADVGGRLNRLTIGSSILDGLKLNEDTLLSSIEDADVSELMTDLTQQQIVYEAVLRSTSAIMQLNLSKFI
ncbi:MAG: flagellar hook-associated protein FlgL [Pseudodesulfovibrio sp.]